MGDSLKDKITGTGKGIADFFISFSSEYPAILDFIVYAAAFVGVMLVASSIFELVRMGKNAHTQQSRASFFSITTKNVGGVFLMAFIWSVGLFSGSLWSEHDPLNLGKYDMSAAKGDYSEQAIAAATGFIILTGCVVLFRAYLALAKLGSLPEDQRGEQWGYVISRLLAGSVLVCITTVVGMFQSY